jgi:type II secretion system protein N
MATEALDTNLLQSSKRPKPGDSAAGETPGQRRKKKILKGLAYAFFFLVSLFFFTLLKIPDSAVANFLLNYANANAPGYSVQAEKVAVRFFPLPHLELEKLALDPRFPGAGLPLAFDKLSLYPNPLLGLGTSFTANAYSATINGSASMNSLKIQSSGLELGKFTPLSQAKLDIKGLISSLVVQLSMENRRLATADGEIKLQGKNFVFDPSSLGLPMPLPVLNLGDIDVQGTANNGVVKIEKFKVGSPGKDLELQIATGTITLSDVMLNTRYDLHLLIKPSPAFEAAAKDLTSMLTVMATKRTDGFYGIKLAGTMTGVPSIKKE